ncbi:hypothetical protein GCM10009814_32270 [Lapillicoccus jejuensis]
MLAGEGLTYIQTLISGAAGGMLALVGEVVTSLLGNRSARSRQEAENSRADQAARDAFELEKLLRLDEMLLTCFRLAQTVIDDSDQQNLLAVQLRNAADEVRHLQRLSFSDDVRAATSSAYKEIAQYSWNRDMQDDPSKAGKAVLHAQEIVGARIRLLFGAQSP